MTASIGVMGIACHVLGEAIVISADALGVPVFFTAVVLAAIATSVPDTILSMKDAAKGNYDDAISNALGSNIFDITMCVGVPVLTYTALFGPIDFTGIASDEGVQALRIALVGITLAVMAMLLWRCRVGTKHALLMLAIYAGWLGTIIHQAT